MSVAAGLIQITVRDGVAYLPALPDDLHEAVVNATSFKPANIDYAAPNRADKRHKLMRNNKLPVGLLPRVVALMQTNGYGVQLVSADSFQAPKPECRMVVHGVCPRDYQEEAQLATVLHDRGTIKAPTGSGKTLMGAMIIQAKGRHAVVVVPTIDLLYQFKEVLEQMLVYASGQSGKIGQLGDGVVDPQPVTVATARTLSKVLGVAYESYEFGEYDDSDDTHVNPAALRYWVEQLGTVLVDEAHILGAKTVYGVATRIPAPYKYGMSASPWRDDGADLMIEAATGPVIYAVDPKRLVDGGYLLAPEIVVTDTSKWWTAAAWGAVCVRCGAQRLKWAPECRHCGARRFRSQFQEAYKQEIVDNVLRNLNVAKIVHELDRPTLVLVKQVKHGRELAQMIPQSVFLSGRDRGSHRADVFEQVRQGEVRVIVCTTIADMGIDISNLGALVLAGGGKSSTRHLQRIGRVVRAAPGKPRPVVVDFVDGHVHSWFANHAEARRRIEHAEWGDLATWRHQ